MGRFQFGAERRDIWRGLLTSGASQTKSVLEKLLDALAVRNDDKFSERLHAVTKHYLAIQEKERAFDWRYYLVKYPEMRTGDSGIYAGSNGPMSFRVCMLNKTQMNSKYRDPFLLAIYRRSGAYKYRDVTDPWFTSYAYHERWLELGHGGTAITCHEDGLFIRRPTIDSYQPGFDKVATARGLEGNGLLRVSQVEREGRVYDVQDRILLGEAFVRDLLLAF
jgi:hypothetical protein